MTRAMMIVAILILMSACGGSQAIQMKGENEDLVLLAGDWQGEYKGVETGRQGTIKFSLGVGRHTADGYVKMFPDGVKGAPDALKISFVEVEEGHVSGKIDSYVDPSCNCQVQTIFIGNVDGDNIDGTFETVVIGTDKKQSGNWSAFRYDS